MSETENDKADFDDLNTPTEQFGAIDADGMPDPTAAAALPAEAEQQAVEGEEGPEEEKKAGLLARLTETSPYTLMLAISLLAILLAIYCLFREWGSYGFDTRATTTKQRAAVELPWPFAQHVLTADAGAAELRHI